MASFRKQRVQDLLLSFLASEIRYLSDPRLALVSITAVDVSPDLKVAKVFWMHSVIGGADQIDQTSDSQGQETQEIQRALEGARGKLKRRIGEELELRYVPDLRFTFDISIVRGARIDQLLGKEETP